MAAGPEGGAIGVTLCRLEGIARLFDFVFPRFSLLSQQYASPTRSLAYGDNRLM